MMHAHKIKGNFRPLQDYVLLEPIPEPAEKGGILLPDSARKYRGCKVVAVGPGAVTTTGVRVPCELKVGETVWLQKFVEGEMKFNLNGKDVFAIRERHLNVRLVA